MPDTRKSHTGTIFPAELLTDRLCLRPWRKADAAQLLPVLERNTRHLGDWIPAHVSTPVPLPDLEHRLAGFAADFRDGRSWRYAIFSRARDHVIGEVSLFPRSATGRTDLAAADRFEIGYWLAEDATGHGYATEAARALLAAALRQPGASCVEIHCDPRNARSAAVPQRLGFRPSPSGPAFSQVWVYPVPETAQAPIVLEPYNAAWPQLFEQERVRLASVLDEWREGPIEHIGSTAVPGLTAKPVIDIMAGVRNLESSLGARTAVESLGYMYFPYRPDVMHWFCKPSPAYRTHHLHLVPVGSSLWADRITFRDYLRSSTTAAAEYAALKLELAVRYPLDRESYTEAKGDFVRAILETARHP